MERKTNRILPGMIFTSHYVYCNTRRKTHFSALNLFTDYFLLYSYLLSVMIGLYYIVVQKPVKMLRFPLYLQGMV